MVTPTGVSNERINMAALRIMAPSNYLNQWLANAERHVTDKFLSVWYHSNMKDNFHRQPQNTVIEVLL